MQTIVQAWRALPGAAQVVFCLWMVGMLVLTAGASVAVVSDGDEG